jgi:hypothetical protein
MNKGTWLMILKEYVAALICLSVLSQSKNVVCSVSLQKFGDQVMNNLSLFGDVSSVT